MRLRRTHTIQSGPDRLTMAQCQTIALEAIPTSLTVQVSAVRVKTGELVKVNEPAGQALRDLQETITKYRALLEHMQL